MSTENKRLSMAEQLMDSMPEKSLQILDSINTDNLGSDGKYALYCLLKSQALDKNYIDVDKDTLIKVAYNFYKDSDDDYHKMLSCFYYGRILLTANNYPLSLDYLFEALDIAKYMNDYYWQGRITREICAIFTNTYYWNDALMFANSSYENMAKSGKQPFINYAFLDVVRAYLNSNDYDKSLSLSEQLLDSAAVYSDEYLEILTRRIRVITFFSQKDYSNTLKEIEKLKNSEDGFDTQIRCISALSHLELGEHNYLDSLSEFMDFEINDGVLLKLSRIYKEQKDYKSQAEILEKLYNSTYKLYIESFSQNFSQTIAEHYSKENIAKANELSKEKDRNRYVICMVSLLLLLTLLLTSYIIPKQKEQKNIMIAEDLRRILKVKEAENEKISEMVTKILSSKYNVLDNLFRTIYETPSNKTKQKVSDEVDSIVKSFSKESEKIFELEESINSAMSGLMTSFKNDYPDLRDADVLLFLYSVLGFSDSAIALFLNEEKINAVYNRRFRLKKRIKLSESKRKEEYLTFLSR